MRPAIAIIFGALAVFVASAGPAFAQDGSGGQWLAWAGCWEGSTDLGQAAGDADTFLVCIEPTGPGTAELATYEGGELVALETVAADGQSQPFEEGGCQGQRVSSWSDDGARLFLSSSTDCGGGVMRRTSGVLAMLPRGAGWVEVQSVDVGESAPVVGIRSFGPATESRVAEQGAADAAAGREVAVGTARAQAGAALSPSDIVELVDVVGPAVTSALIVERGERFGLDGETLEALSDRGVPGEVVDVMVAVSYPERFEITGGGADVEATPRDVGVPLAERSSRTRAYRGYSPWAFGFDLYWDPYWSSWSRLGYSWGYPFGFGYDRFGYSRFGYGGFGYPYGYVSPRVVFIESPTVRDRGARLSRETGVVRNTGGSGSSDRPSISRTRGVAPSSGASSSPPRTTRSSGDSGGSSSGGSGNVRTARPRN